MMSSYSLPNLPYKFDALEPHLSGEILDLHHSKHHAAYVKGANEAIDKLAEARKSDEYDYIGQLEKNLAFNLSGHVLHSILWKNMRSEERRVGKESRAGRAPTHSRNSREEECESHRDTK